MLQRCRVLILSGLWIFSTCSVDAATSKELVSNVAHVEISPNITRLDISDPKLPNMSFYNLSELISVHEPGWGSVLGRAQ